VAIKEDRADNGDVLPVGGLSRGRIVTARQLLDDIFASGKRAARRGMTSKFSSAPYEQAAPKH